MGFSRSSSVAAAALLLLLAAAAPPAASQNDGSQRTALDDFVFSEESLSQFSYFHAEEYDWDGRAPFTQVGFHAYVLNMTSGEWQTEAEVGVRSHWWHILILIIPDNLNPDYASNMTVYVTGNHNSDSDDTGMPDHTDVDLFLCSTLATGARMPVGVLYHVPNSRVTFASDPEQQSRSEDDIVAYSWAEYLQDTDKPELNVYLPMIRAAVRSMDALTDFSLEQFGNNVTHYTFSGASKRGWTSWLTGAMDQERVAAIAPIVWDGISLNNIFHHQYRSYGGWAFAIEPYVTNEVVQHLDTPEMLEMLNLIDPFNYRTRLTMPKLVVTGLMDEFQMPDDEQYWWDELPSGPTDGSSAPSDGNTKWLVKNPNTEHSQITGLGVTLPVMGTWISYLLNGWELPYLTWEYDEASGDVTVMPHGGEVYSAQMWYATSCNDTRRDFRITTLDDPCTCGPVIPDDDESYCLALDALWDEQKLEANEDGSYTAHMDPPSDGRWTAFVGNIQMTTEYTFKDHPSHNFFTRGVRDDSAGAEPRWPFTPKGVLEFSSRASVVPNTFPYEDCTQEGCDGDLV